MCGTPQKDADGNTLPHDDPAIDNAHRVIRRVPPDQWIDRGDGTYGPSSGLFSPSSDPHRTMSVDLEQALLADGLTPEDVLKSTTHGAVALIVGDLRALRLQVGCDAVPENKYHGGVWGGLTSSNTRKKVRAKAIILFLPKKTNQ